jgi:hypothetical protein
MDLLVAAHADTGSVNPAESIESLLQQGFNLEMRRVERFENSTGFAMGDASTQVWQLHDRLRDRFSAAHAVHFSSQNDVCRLQQIRRAANLRPGLLASLSPPPRSDQHRTPTPRSLCHEHVPQPVADHPALRQIRPQFATQQVQHGRFGLATPTALVRAVRTEVASLDRDPKACEIGEQMLLKIMIVLFAVVAPTDAALVCNDRKRIPSGPKTLQALNHAG